MRQPTSEQAGSITERLLANGGGLGRLCEPLGTRYSPKPGDGEPGGGSFSKYPGWDEMPHPWSQRAGSGDAYAERGASR